ncbi:MAG: hypothetical protein ACJ0H0_08020 [Vicinamibacterales bacterium]
MPYQYEATARPVSVSEEQRVLRPVLREAVSTMPSRASLEKSQICVVCQRVSARLTLKVTSPENSQVQPPRLCLRCHHAVMQQRKMIRMRRSGFGTRNAQLTFEDGLIVPRVSELAGAAKYDQLLKSRRRAQKAARRAIEPDDRELKIAANF